MAGFALNLSSASLEAARRLKGMAYRTGVLGRVVRDIYRDVDAGFTQVENLYRTVGLTINAEDSGAIQVDVQVQDMSGTVSSAHYVRVSLWGANPDGDGSAEITMGVTSGGVGTEVLNTKIATESASALDEDIAMAIFTTNANGLLNIDVTDSSGGSDTVYLLVEVISESDGTAFMSAPVMATLNFEA